MWPFNFAKVKKLKQRNTELENLLNQNLYWGTIFKGMPISFVDEPEELLDAGYMDNPDVYSLINYVARTAAAVELKLYNKNGDEVTDHEVLQLMDKPNPDMSFTELIEAFYIYKFGIGNGYLYKPTIETGLNAGKTQELWIMPGASTQAVGGTWTEPIQGYKILEGEYWHEIPKQDVYHGKFFNPKFENGSWVYGLSPVKIAIELIRTQNYGYTALESSYLNGSPPYIISAKTEDPLTEEQQENLEEKYKEKYGSAENFRKPMLSSVPLDVKMLGMSPADLKILEVNKQGMRTLANVMGGIPTVLLNDLENATYSNYKEARKVLYENVIMPNNKSLQEGLTSWLLPPYEEGLYFKYDYSNIEALQEGFGEKTAAIKDAFYLTINEQREILGFPAIAGGDEIVMPNRVQNQSVKDYLKTLKL